MSKKMKLVPELRFPEFESGKWNIKTVDDYCNVYRGSAFSKADMIEDGSEHCIHYGELFTKYDEVIREILSRTNKQDGFRSESGDVLMPSSDVTPDGLAKASAITLDGVILGGDMNILRPKTEINSIFLSYLLNHSKREIIKLVSGTTVKHIYPSQIITCEITVIDNEIEQQKIASCLSSLDELLAAHNDKLDALKDHKKGLMQNLFPQDGETVPRVRFKEFKNDGAWVEKSIQKLIDDKIIVGHLDGNHGALYPKASEFSEEGVPYITANDFVSGLVDFTNCKHLPLQRAKKFKKGVAKDGDILFAHNATVGPVAKLVTDLPFVILSTTATYYRCDNKVLINDFLKFALTSPSFVGQYTRVMSQSTRNQVPITTQRKFHLHLPKPEEQQKIASCLSTLDELINAQAEKIEQLQQHKKGLMQGLFPKIEG